MMQTRGIVVISFWVASLGQLHAQSLEQRVEEYIRVNKVKTVSGSDTNYMKSGQPYLRKYPSGKMSLTVPKGAIPIPVSTGRDEATGKFYSADVPSEVKLVLYAVQVTADGKEKTTAVSGGIVPKGHRTCVNMMVDYKDRREVTAYCYFLSGVVFGLPYSLSPNCVAKICNFRKQDFSLDKYLPALLIYEEENHSTQKQKLVERMKSGQELELVFDRKKYKDIYKQLGNYCLVYYKFEKP